MPQWNCRSGVASVELPQWSCRLHRRYLLLMKESEHIKGMYKIDFGLTLLFLEFIGLQTVQDAINFLEMEFIISKTMAISPGLCFSQW